jgi:hypothetical protein
MTITVTPRASAGESTGSAQTKTTTSFTPTANSMLYMFAGAARDGAGVAIDLTESANTGGLTFTRLIQSGTGGTFFGAAALWEAAVGSSPGSMTITIDAGAGAIVGYIAYSVFDVIGSLDGIRVKTGQIKANAEADAGGNTETHTTGTFDVAATTGNAVIVGFSSNSDGGGSPAVPASGGFSAIHTTVGTFTNISTFASTTFTGTNTTCPDLGQTVNGSGSVLFELEEFSITPPPDLILPVVRSTLRLG